MVNSQVTSITPAIHADRHSVGGADPLVNPLLLHAARHGKGGGDVIGETLSAMAKSVTSAGYTKIKEMSLISSGNIDVTFELYGSENDTTNSAKVYINGVAAGIERSGCVSNFALIGVYTETFNGLVTDDLIQIYGKNATGNGARTTTIRNLYLNGSTGIVQDP